MPGHDNALKFMAAAIMKLQSQSQAQDLLLRALYVERATQREAFPSEAEEEIFAMADSIEGQPRSGYEGEEQHLADVQVAIRSFATTLRARLDEQR